MSGLLGLQRGCIQLVYVCFPVSLCLVGTSPVGTTRGPVKIHKMPFPSLRQALVPAFVLSVLSVCSLWLPPTVEERE